MITTTINNQTINVNKICKISDILSVDNKYYFIIHLSGCAIDSQKYDTELEAENARNTLDNLVE